MATPRGLPAARPARSNAPKLALRLVTCRLSFFWLPAPRASAIILFRYTPLMKVQQLGFRPERAGPIWRGRNEWDGPESAEPRDRRGEDGRLLVVSVVHEVKYVRKDIHVAVSIRVDRSQPAGS